MPTAKAAEQLPAQLPQLEARAATDQISQIDHADGGSAPLSAFSVVYTGSFYLLLPH